MKNFLRQKNIYYGFNFINRFMVYMPVFVLFLKMKGLNQTHVMVMMSAYNIAIMVGEIPTGILADRISRKTSVMLGCIIQGGAMLFMLPVSNFYALVFIEILFGIGMTMQSGAMSAMFYDYLKSIHKEEMYAEIEGKRWGCVFISQALASIIGGFIANYRIEFTILITGIAYLISTAILVLFVEVPVTVEKKFRYVQHVRTTFRYMMATKNIVILLFIIVFTGALFSTTLWLYQPYYQNIGIKVSAYGIAYFLMNSVSALGGFLSGKIKLSTKKILLFYMFGNALFIGMMGVIRSGIGIVIPSIIFFINGLLNPWLQSFWEKHIENENRATASSILSLVSSLLFAIVAIPLGFISDNISVFAAFGISAMVYSFISVLFYLGIRRISTESSFKNTI